MLARFQILAAAATLLFFLSPAVADDPKIAFERYKLENGMEVILHPDNSVPLVAVNVWYHVGSGDESHGKSGFAHLFEHMLFQGSKNVGEDKHFAILKEIGATGVNGTTNFDRTNYFEVVPSHQVEVGLWLESDRMGYLLPLVTKKSLDNQIEVVRNERRQRVDNVPYGKTQMKMFEMLYPEGHPYRYVVIGKHEDLASAKLENVKSFYSKWYAPANATLVLAGDFDVAEAKKLVEKWFGSFPASTKPERRPPETPVLSATSRIEITDDLAKLRRVDYLWHTPAFYAPGDAELDIAGDALARTGTGRLYKILVHEKQLAQSVAAYQSSREYSSHFGISVTLRSGADQAEVEKIVEAELERLRREPVTQRELDRAVVNFESGVVWSLESLNARADLLQRYNHYLGDPNGITRDLDRYRDSSPEAVQKTIARYLGKDNRVEIVTLPGEAKGK